MIKKLAAHSLIYTLAPQAPKIVSLVLMPVITKYVTAVDYGVYGVITSYLFFITALKDLGFGVVFVNTFYKHTRKWPVIWRMLHGHLVFWSIIYSALILVVLKIAIPADKAAMYWPIAFLTAIPALLFENTATIGNYYFRFRQQPMVVGLVTALTGIISVVVTYVCIVYLSLGYISWFISSFVASGVMFFMYFYPLYIKMRLAPILKFRKSFIQRYLRVALPMVPHNYSSFLLNSSDRVVLNSYKVNISQIGIYNVAYSFGSYFEAVGEAIGMAVGPYYSKLYTERTPKALKDERSLTFFLMSGFLAATFLVSLWLKEFFQILISNPELRSGYQIGVFIIMGYAYRPMYWSAGIKLSICEKTSLLWRISFIAGLLNVVLNVLFVPLYGIYAAAISTLISLLYIGFSGFFFPSFRKLGGEDHHPVKWMLAIGILTLAAYLLKDASITMKFSVTVGIIGAIALLLKRNLHVIKGIEI